MLLRSGKSLNKRPKHSSADDEIKKEIQDFISRLPDAMLIQILTLLSDADANRTCVLSHMWNPIRAFLPGLRIVMPIFESIVQVKKFHNSVDQTLAIQRGSTIPIQKFFFYASKKCDYHHVYDSLCTVVECQVQEMELSFLDDLYKVRFCWDLFKTCNTLVVLTLKGGFVIRVPKAKVLFPCMKRMNLLSIGYSSKMSFQYLISGCPSLEELFVERIQVLKDGLHTLKVSSPTLKKLVIVVMMRVTWDNKVVFDVPNLEYLYFVDDMDSEYSLMKPSSLIEATIFTYSKSVAKLLKWFASAKVLELGRRTVMFAYQSFYWIWNPPEDAHAPACLHSKMKEIIILNLKTISQEGVIYIMYLLKYSNILEKLAINAHEIDHNRREQILNCHRGSNLCQIDFV